MNNRVKEIKEAIDKKNQELVSLRKELKDIILNCDHKRRSMIGSDPNGYRFFMSRLSV